MATCSSAPLQTAALIPREHKRPQSSSRAQLSLNPSHISTKAQALLRPRRHQISRNPVLCTLQGQWSTSNPPLPVARRTAAFQLQSEWTSPADEDTASGGGLGGESWLARSQEAAAPLMGPLIGCIIALLACIAPAPAVAAAYPCEDLKSYYSSVDKLRGPELKAALHDIVKGHKVYTYAQVWEALKLLDAVGSGDPAASANIEEIYTSRVVPKELAGDKEGWNREHLWPRSFGLTANTPQFSDLHNLRPADVNVNSSRGNKYYGECSQEPDARCLVPANREAAPDTATNNNLWTPPAKVRGDIARALFYMAVRYEGEEPDSKNLELSDQPSVADARMGQLSTLLRWHQQDPPSPAEQTRNARVCSLYQHNRNPFVDHPEYVVRVFGEPGALTPPAAPAARAPSLAAQEGANLAAPLPPLPALSGTTREWSSGAWVNELHYDNEGPDAGEFVEVVVAPGEDPASLSVVLYNGNNNKPYLELPVKDFTPGQVAQGFRVFYSVLKPGSIQNGPADGLALLQRGQVLQFISYEGALTAVDGPAKGFRSVDVQVAETGTSPLGSSLGLQDSVFSQKQPGRWSVFAKGSPGQLNPGQRVQ